jgi:hypothetical protein
MRAAFLISFIAVAATAEPARQTIIVCAPGSPGTTAEAQPAMDAFASAASKKSGVELSARYEPTESGGVAALPQAGIGIVSTPFFLVHEKELHLKPRLEVVRKGRPAREPWVLVAQKGRVKTGKALAGFTIVSSAGFAPAFVRGAVSSLGPLPADVKIQQSGAVLTALRRAMAGEDVAVLLDGTEAAAIDSLPSADKLEVVARSSALPVGLVVTIDARVPDGQWKAIGNALLGLASDPATGGALEGLQIASFAPLDSKVLAAARGLVTGSKK